jgi:hypothetical protein
MPFADDLLEQAYHLANREPEDPKQASLRRAVSTAYYALFHLLIEEAVGNWGVARQRSILARTFEHGKMKSICDDHVKSFYSAVVPRMGFNWKTWPTRLPLCSNNGTPPIMIMPFIGPERMRLAR